MSIMIAGESLPIRGKIASLQLRSFFSMIRGSGFCYSGVTEAMKGFRRQKAQTAKS